MLILSRGRSEQIDITSPTGERIVIQTVSVRRNVARIGVDAPDGWTVDRREVTVAKECEQRAELA